MSCFTSIHAPFSSKRKSHKNQNPPRITFNYITLKLLLRVVSTDTETGMLPGVPGSAICVQKFDDSLNSAIRITYRISLRSSSLREPRYPLLRVVQHFVISMFSSIRKNTPIIKRFSTNKSYKGLKVLNKNREAVGITPPTSGTTTGAHWVYTLDTC